MVRRVERMRDELLNEHLFISYRHARQIIEDRIRVAAVTQVYEWALLCFVLCQAPWNGIAISMDGKGAWRDNVLVERLWRSVKYEEVYLKAYDSVSEARASIGRYLDFYNGRRPHSSLDGTTPDQAYFTPLPIRMAA